MSLSPSGALPKIFVSHAGPDQAWAEWAARQLRASGYEIELDSISWPAGTNFVEAMHKALARTNPMLVLLSHAYLDPDRYTMDEWTSRLAQRRRDLAASLIPVRIEDVPLGGLWAPIVVPDLFNLGPSQAAAALLEAVNSVVGQVPATAPPPLYHSTPAGVTREHGPRPPGSLPPVWNLIRRNPMFTGRIAMLDALHDALHHHRRAAIQTLHGIGGVGKTQLALEYSHRFAREYDAVWWVASEQAELIGDHLIGLATAARIAPAGTPAPIALDGLRAHLRRTPRWLLVFDNANDRDQLMGWLPDGPGHVIITSRNPCWAGVADTVDVDVFSRSESIAFLAARLPRLTTDEANRLASELGDLPLAIAQVADLLAETGMRVAACLRALRAHATDLLDGDRPPAGYPASLASAVILAVRRLTTDAPAAAQLLTLCAYLAPEPIPLDIFRSAADQLPAPLSQVAARSVDLDRTVGKLVRYGLARITDDGPLLHRLTQAVLRDADQNRVQHRRTVADLLIATQPDDGVSPAQWPRWSAVLPHILATDPAASDNRDLRMLVLTAVRHLIARGDARTALHIVKPLIQAWWWGPTAPEPRETFHAASLLAYAHRELGHYRKAERIDVHVLDWRRRMFGEDDPDTLSSANNLAIDLRLQKDHEGAHRIDKDTLDRFRRVLGDDNPLTLNSANNFAEDLRLLGDHEQARRLAEDTFSRRRRISGEDHPDTLSSANTVAIHLAAAGDYKRAKRLHEDTLTRRRRVLGDDHPETLRSAFNLALELSQIGDHEHSRQLNEDTLTRRRRVLGPDHPDTLESAHSLAVDLYQAGDFEQACQLDGNTLTRRRRVLGDDHPHTLDSASNLATGLEKLGKRGRARRLRAKFDRRHPDIPRGNIVDRDQA